MPSSNVAHLRENGPSTLEEMPLSKVTVKDRQNGVWRFSHRASSNDLVGTTTVYYLPDRHSKVDVAERFFEANPSAIPDDTHELGMFKQTLSSEWQDAIDEVWNGGE